MDESGRETKQLYQSNKIPLKNSTRNVNKFQYAANWSGDIRIHKVNAECYGNSYRLKWHFINDSIFVDFFIGPTNCTYSDRWTQKKLEYFKERWCFNPNWTFVDTIQLFSDEN